MQTISQTLIIHTRLEEIRLSIAKGIITYGMELMLAFLKIIQGVISFIMNVVGFGGATEMVLPAEIVTAIVNCGFFESIPLWAVIFIYTHK